MQEFSQVFQDLLRCFFQSFLLHLFSDLLHLKIRFGQARERKQLQWRESFNVFSGVGFRCGSKRGKKNVVSMVSHTFG